ncbi:ABC transporter substrate-binding protein [Frankia sp. AgB32]|uniref:ABC transporter substrate-binding protein n=1 Tax=Frankia sp. AgB32 TaxID=631119 RepID=UPI00200FC178|nr:ABC transporter substrate-binding protein [Frankia sp. AgB32]MCK9895312.1 ABC transporter substrate-binding protein [Frankia sp. AgB32]
MVIGRRGFLGLGVLAGSSVLLAACGSGGDAVSSTGKEGGTLRWGWAEVTSWDPVTSSAGWDVHALSLVYAALTKLDELGNPVPAAAESWKYNDRGDQITFVLRPGLTFSDGTPLNATAVKKSLERGRDFAGSLVAAQLVSMQTITANDDARTVTIGLSTVDYQIPSLLAGKTGMIVSPTAFAKDAKGLATKPVGAGPFRLTAYVPNQSAKLVRFPGYWDKANIHLDAFELYPAPEAATAIAALQSGRLDVAQLPGSQVAAAKSAGLEVQVIPSLVTTVLDVNVTKAPFDNPKVVEAFKYAIDRQALVQTQTFGLGTVNYQPFPPGYVGHDPSLDNAFGYDPDKAKKLLAEAGHATGLSVALTTTGQSSELSEQLQAQLAKVGVKLTIDTIPLSQATQIMYIQHSRPIAVDGFAGRDSAVQAFQVLFGDQGLMNPGRRTPPELTAALQKVRHTPLDDPSYPTVLQAATKIAVEQMPNIFLFTQPRILARKKNVSPLGNYLAVQRFEGVRVS